MNITTKRTLNMDRIVLHLNHKIIIIDYLRSLKQLFKNNQNSDSQRIPTKHWYLVEFLIPNYNFLSI